MNWTWAVGVPKELVGVPPPCPLWALALSYVLAVSHKHHAELVPSVHSDDDRMGSLKCNSYSIEGRLVSLSLGCLEVLN